MARRESPQRAVSEMSTKAERTQGSAFAGSDPEPSNQLEDDENPSNAAMANPASRAAVAPVPRLYLAVRQEDSKSRVTTTHDVHGGGNPRLVMVFNDSVDFVHAEQEHFAKAGEKQIPKVFPLVPGITTIGSADDCDIWLPGLKPHHAEVRRDELDEYKIFDLSGGNTVIDGGRTAIDIQLHAGRRIQVGDWTMIYQRDEFADHGSPYGGHAGGMFAGYRKVQSVPRPRGTSPEGGSEPTDTDPGEYF